MRIFWQIALFILALSFVEGANATTRYISQAGGLFTGGSNCNGQTTITPATFAGLANSPGDTYYLCGTITNIIQPENSGSSGNPITLFFDTGASIQMLNCGDFGCIDLNALSWWIVDGSSTSTPCGYVAQIDVACNGNITCTNVGTGLGNSSCVGVYMRGGGAHNEIRNLGLYNLYVHTCPNPTTCNDLNATHNYYGIWFDGANNSIHNIQCHDAYGCVKGEAGASTTNIFNSHFYNSNWGVFFSGTSNASGTPLITTITVHDNDIHDFCNWDETGNQDHHNGVAFAGNNNLANGVTAISIYNNFLHGCLSQTAVNNMTALVFFNDGNNVATGDNIFAPSNGTFVLNGLIFYWSPGTLNSNSTIDNNTIVCATNASNTGAGVSIEGDASMTFRNNVISGCNIDIRVYTSTGPQTTFTSMTKTGYQNTTLTNLWELCTSNGCSTQTFYSTLATWETAVLACCSGAETGSIAQTASFNLNSSYRQNTGSAIIGIGDNLTGTPAFLNSDAIGNARPAPATAWDLGAYFGAASSGSGFVTQTNYIYP